MPDKLVTLATFGKSYEAELARNRLEAEGIAVHLSDETISALWGLGDPFGTVKLQVAEADLDRAGNILDSVGEPRGTDDAGDPPPDDAIQAGWTCSRCEAEVSPARDTCPVCGAPADDLDEFTPPPSTAISPVRRAVVEGDEEDPATRAGDALAARAFRATVLLWLLPPFVYLYSLWLLARLFAYDGELSPAGERRLYGALAIHGAVVLGVVLLLVLA